MTRRTYRGLFSAAQDAADIAPEHLHCRDLGHTWRPYSVARVPQRRQWREVLNCIQCGTLRTRWLSDLGEVLGSSYSYADGYQRIGLGAWTTDLRASVRVASLRQMWEGGTVETSTLTEEEGLKRGA